MSDTSTQTCPQCGASSPFGHRFCGHCGGRMDAPAPAPAPQGGGNKTMFFGQMQAPGKAKLILIKGEGLDGISYHLSGTEHVAGRLEGAILFPEDPLLSPHHANFLYREGRLFVQDEGSTNGVFVRIRQSVTLDSGSVFLIGEQLLQVEATAPDLGQHDLQADAEGTCFYASPKRPSKLKLVQRLRGGEIGMIYRARNDTLSIGREENDINFPDDPFISGRHAEVSVSDGGRFVLTDHGSKNGTFLRIREEAPLSHGDYVFLGQQLLRVEIT